MLPNIGYNINMSASGQSSLLLALFLVAALLIPVHASYAASTVKSVTLNGFTRKIGKKTSVIVDAGNATVHYNVQVKDGNTGEVKGTNITVPHGTSLAFQFLEHESEDISWFQTGSAHGSPYGDWISGAAKPPSGTFKSIAGGLWGGGTRRASQVGGSTISGGGNRTFVGNYSVSPPGKSISGLGSNSCSDANNNGKTCTMNTPGTHTVHFNFNSTAGRMWYEARGSKASYSTSEAANVPAGTITYTIEVLEPSDGNQSPSDPTLSGTSCTAGTPMTITMSATDPDGDMIRYLIDWDNNGSVDQIAPSYGYVASGTTYEASRIFGISGSKIVKVRTGDENGALSGWATFTFSCEELPQLSQDDDDSGGAGGGILSDTPPFILNPSADLAITAIPSLVRFGEITHVNWSAENVQSCTVLGDNGDSWSGTISSVGGETSSPIEGRVVYTLLCIDLNDVPKSETASVNIVPTWQEI